MPVVNVNDVYELCYAIAAKQQAGFPSPDDFNRYAQLANIDLYNYYNDERDKQFAQVKNGDAIYMPPILSDFVQHNIPMPTVSNSASLPGDYSYVIAMKTTISGVNKTIKKVDYDKEEEYLNSTIDTPTATQPIFVELHDQILYYPTLSTPIYMTYYRYPATPVWGYTMVGGRPKYSVGSSVNFEWEETEIYRLSMRILEYMGISIRDTELTQYAIQSKMESA